MKLRKLMELCIHERCSAHWILDPEDERGGEMCSGGVFLPDDTLVIEKVDGEWPKWAKTAIHDWFTKVQRNKSERPSVRSAALEHPASVLLDVLSGETPGPRLIARRGGS